MAKSAATATSADLSCWRGPLEERLRKAVGRALAEQPKDPCTAVALELLRGTGLGEGAAALSAQQAEQEDGPQDDLAGRPSGHAHKNIEMELRKLKDEIQSLKIQLNNVDAEPAAEWGVAGWVNSLALTEVVAEALKEPAGTDPFKYVLSLSLADLESKLEAVKLSGLAAPLWSAIEKLRGQSAATGAALNAKFAAEGDAFKGEMCFGGVEQFFGGLEKLIGPPLMVGGSLLKAMETEHCAEKDADVPFDTSNGIMGATSRLEWEFVVAPVVEDGRYAERGGDFRTVHPEWCRKPVSLSVYQKKMAREVSPLLEKAGQAPLTLEELVAGRLYTGPMYEKYNGVLRFFSARDADGAVRLEYASVGEVPFLQKKCGWLHLGEWAATAAGTGEPAAMRWTWHNQYSTTIHAINSIIVKLSPLTRITPLYRGWTGATLPQAFFKPDALGFRGGVEYGFSSTTTDRAQAVHYAAGKASTVLELAMGMIERGADISWLSQYPHERETLLPPLMGLQVRSTGVEGSTLVVQSSFSINMASQTLEQVAGKRKKLLTDMGAQMAAEVRRGVAEEAAEEASQLVRARLGLERCADAGGAADERLEAPLSEDAEAYNSDPRFQAAVSDALKVKRAAMLAAAMQHGGGGGLAAAMDMVLPLQAGGVDLSGFDFGSDDGAVVGTVVAWMKSEPSALTSLKLDLGKACSRVREAVLDMVRTTCTLVALSVGEKGAMPLNPLQLNGREAVPSLELSNKGLGPISVAVIAAGLSVNKVLTEVNLSNNNLGGETDFIKASEVEGESKEVGAKVMYEGREMIVSAGVDSDGDLKLIDTTGVLAIAKALEVNAVVTDLDLQGNAISDVGATTIADALKGNAVLTELKLGDNEIGSKGAAAIAEALRGNEVLKTLSLVNNQIGPRGAVIAEALRGNEVLTTLDLSSNGLCGIDEEGDGEYDASCIVALADALKVNEVLANLDLSYNSIGAKDAKAIGKALEVNEVLTKLDLGLNEIGSKGAKAIGEALKVNEVLTNLVLSDNSIGKGGAVALASALRVNAVLTDLNLSDNKICDVGAAAIAEALRGNEVLKGIDLQDNMLDRGKGFSRFFGRNGKRVIRDAVSGREGFELKM